MTDTLSAPSCQKFHDFFQIIWTFFCFTLKEISQTNKIFSPTEFWILQTMFYIARKMLTRLLGHANNCNMWLLHSCLFGNTDFNMSRSSGAMFTRDQFDHK